MINGWVEGRKGKRERKEGWGEGGGEEKREGR